MNSDSQTTARVEREAQPLRPRAVQPSATSTAPHPLMSTGSSNGNGKPAQSPLATVRVDLLGARSKAVAASPEVQPRPGEAITRELEQLAAGATARQFTERVYARAREILGEAYESAAELRLEALGRIREQLHRVGEAEIDSRSRLDEQADTLRAQAALEAKLALQRAQRDGDALTARAREQADRIVHETIQQAEEVKASARREAQEIIAEAREITDQARRRTQAVETLEQQFERTANEFVKWLGYPINNKQNRAARMAGKTR